MSLKRVQVGISDDELKRLEELAKKYGFTYSGALRYCFNKVADEEGIAHGKKPPPARH